jgi:hypothetical protein
MNLWLRISFLFWLAASSGSAQSLFPNLGGQRTGISGFQFLKIPVSARQAALSGTGVTTINDASAMYINPAMTVESMQSNASFNYGAWFAGLRHLSGNLVYKLSENDALGIGFVTLRTDDLPVTTAVNPDGTGETFSYGDVQASLHYSKRLTEQFSFGLNANFLQQTLGSLVARTGLIDLGVCYRIPVANMRIGATLQHFGNAATPSGTANVFGIGTVQNFQAISPPTFFRLGFSFDALSSKLQRLTILTQLNHPNDNKETVALAAEYAFKNQFMIRAGYDFGKDEQSFPDLGVGVVQKLGAASVRVDYAFANFKTLGGTHRISVGLTAF